MPRFMHRKVGISKIARSYRNDGHFSYRKVAHFWHSEASFLLVTVLQQKWCVEGGDESGVVMWADNPSFVPQYVPTFAAHIEMNIIIIPKWKLRGRHYGLYGNFLSAGGFVLNTPDAILARCIEHKTVGTHARRRVKLSLINPPFFCNKSGWTYSERNIIFTILK